MTMPNTPIPPSDLGALKEVSTAGGGVVIVVVTSSRGEGVGVSSIDIANRVDTAAEKGCRIVAALEGDTKENEEPEVAIKRTATTAIQAQSRGAWRGGMRAILLRQCQWKRTTAAKL